MESKHFGDICKLSLTYGRNPSLYNTFYNQAEDTVRQFFLSQVKPLLDVMLQSRARARRGRENAKKK
jgi:hypothetical protein